MTCDLSRTIEHVHEHGKVAERGGGVGSNGGVRRRGNLGVREPASGPRQQLCLASPAAATTCRLGRLLLLPAQTGKPYSFAYLKCTAHCAKITECHVTITSPHMYMRKSVHESVIVCG